MTEGRHYKAATISNILSRIEHIDTRPFLMVVDGADGAGKSTLARELAEAFNGSVAIVRGDDFYADLDDDYRARLDAEGGCREYFDWQRLREQVYAPARAGLPITYQRYNWVSATMGDWVAVADVDLLIVEGVYSSRPELRELIDLVIWINTSVNERLRRQAARGENTDHWINRWKAAFDYYRDHVRLAGPDDIEVDGE